MFLPLINGGTLVVADTETDTSEGCHKAFCISYKARDEDNIKLRRMSNKNVNVVSFYQDQTDGTVDIKLNRS